MFRIRVKQFTAAHPEIKGGIYSLETTYNAIEKTWHVHCHILCDLVEQFPPKFIIGTDGEKHKNQILNSSEKRLTLSRARNACAMSSTGCGCGG